MVLCDAEDAIASTPSTPLANVLHHLHFRVREALGERDRMSTRAVCFVSATQANEVKTLALALQSLAMDERSVEA